MAQVLVGAELDGELLAGLLGFSGGAGHGSFCGVVGAHVCRPSEGLSASFYMYLSFTSWWDFYIFFVKKIVDYS